MFTRDISKMPLSIKYFYFPLLRLLGRKFPKYYQELKKTEYSELEKLKEIQTKKLKKLISIAYNHVPFYQKEFAENNLNQFDIESIEDLRKLPVVNKRILKKHFPRQTINNTIMPESIIQNSTSGSTGKPFIFALNWKKKDMIEALKIRNFNYVNYGYGRKYYSLWGFNPQPNFMSIIYRKFILKRYFISSLNMNDKIKQKYANILLNNTNCYLEGYASGLIVLARYMIKNKITASLHGVTATAESLIPEHRELLEKAFGCEVFNRYGTREFGDISHECVKHIGLHVNMESFIVEILDENNKPCPAGVEGRIVITDLDNEVMPFIRYDTEDTGKILDKTCTCGRKSILMGPPSGRIVDTIVTPEGKHLSFGFFVLTFEDHPIVDQFQIIQQSENELKLLIVKNDSFTEKSFKPLLEKVINYCQPMKVEVNYVEEIPTEASGKMRIVKSLREP